MATVIPFRFRPVPPPIEESRDPEELAAETTELLEDYRRAAWTGISDKLRLEKLERAQGLLRRVHDLETGRIAMPVWGD